MKKLDEKRFMYWLELWIKKIMLVGYAGAEGSLRQAIYDDQDTGWVCLIPIILWIFAGSRGLIILQQIIKNQTISELSPFPCNYCCIFILNKKRTKLQNKKILHSTNKNYIFLRSLYSEQFFLHCFIILLYKELLVYIALHYR